MNQGALSFRGSLLCAFLLVVTAFGKGVHPDVATTGGTTVANTVIAYWQTVLPRSTMPSALRDLLTPPAGHGVDISKHNTKILQKARNLGAHSIAEGNNKYRVKRGPQNLADLNPAIFYGKEANGDKLNSAIFNGKDGNRKKPNPAIFYGKEANGGDEVNPAILYGKQETGDKQNPAIFYGKEASEDKVNPVIIYGKQETGDKLNPAIFYGKEGNGDKLNPAIIYGKQETEDKLNPAIFYGKEENGDKLNPAIIYGKQETEDKLNPKIFYGKEANGDKLNPAIIYGKQEIGDKLNPKIFYGKEANGDKLNPAIIYGKQEIGDKLNPAIFYGKEANGDKLNPAIIYGKQETGDKLNPAIFYGKEANGGKLNPAIIYGKQEIGDKLNPAIFYGKEANGDKLNPAIIYGNLNPAIIYGKEANGDNLNPAIFYWRGANDPVHFTIPNNMADGHHHHVHGGHDHFNLRNIAFLEDALTPGSKISPYIHPASPRAPLLPRDAADSIPMSTKSFTDIVRMFAPVSGAMAENIRSVLDLCEHPNPAKGEKKACATSVESMVDLAASMLGTHDLRAFSSPSVPVEGRDSSMAYRIVTVRAITSEGDTMTCHGATFPYKIFVCHALVPTRVYSVMLERDGVEEKMEGLVVCHLNTSEFDPEKMPPNVKPGAAPVCHFLNRDDILWAPAATTLGKEGAINDVAATQ